MSARSRLNVFLSSTCYDLIDARAQLTDRLTRTGFVIRASDDFDSGFNVSGTTNSIDACLRNVEASDVIICLIDKRYGPSLPAPHADKSATHVEIDHARTLGKPVFYFIRNRAFMEFEQLKTNNSHATRWVEPSDVASRQKWLDFVRNIAALPKSADYSNWLDQFDSGVDLCDKVEARLVAAFPQLAISRALDPERLVRLIFVPTSLDGFRQSVIGHFRNETPNLALNLITGWTLGRSANEVLRRGALASQGNFATHQQTDLTYPLPMSPDEESRTVYGCNPVLPQEFYESRL